MFFTESWLKPEILDSMVCPENYSLFRSDRINAKGGGVALFYNNNLRVTEFNPKLKVSANQMLSNFEFLCVDYHDRRYPLRFVCFYIPPNFSNCINTIKTVCEVIDQLSSSKKPCFVLGDFNLPNIDWNIPTSFGNSSHKFFLEFCSANCWSQHVKEATHERSNILDLLLCNVPANDILLSCSVKAPITSTCDHNAISFAIATDSCSRKPEKVTRPNFYNADYAEIRRVLDTITWQSFICNNNLQSYYDNFINTLQVCINNLVPICKPRNSKKRPKHIQSLLQEKKQLYKDLKINPTLKIAYKKVCKNYETAVKMWTDNIESNVCHNPSSKKFYGYVNKQFKTKSTIPPLFDKDRDLICFNDDQKSELLNKYFQQVFINDNGFPPACVPKSFIKMEHYAITSNEIVYAINKMKDKVSRSPENIPIYFIKRVFPSILTPMTFIFNATLELQIVPNQWKSSVVVPIFKKGDRRIPNNYRPISLTSCFSRIFETVIHGRILQHLESNSLISLSQYGFLPNRSSATQLISCFDDWIKGYLNKTCINIVYTDIAKAFDTVSHAKLICVLRSFGLCENVVLWTKEFLSNRCQKVSIGSSLSSPLLVSSGVPQGSVLGPLLFIMFIEDLSRTVDNSLGDSGKIKLFADDAKIYGSNQMLLQESLNTMVTWLDNRQLQIAPHKCFNFNIRKQATTDDQSPFSISSSILENKSVVNDLGVFFSRNLKWSHHVDHIHQKASSTSYRILKCFKTKNIWVLLHLYKTYVRPKLESNTQVWSPYLLQDIAKIESIQRHFTKIAFLHSGINFDSYKDRLEKVGLKSLEERRMVYDMTLVYKILNGMTPINFSDHFEMINITYNLRRNSRQISCKKDFKNNQWENSFFPRVTKIWNSLPEEIVCAESIDIFRTKMKSHSLVHFTKFLNSLP